MKHILLFVFLILSFSFRYSQSNEKIKQFEYYVVGRTSKIKIIITTDSIFNTDYDGHTRIRKIEKSEWESLMKSISEYKLPELICEPSPKIDPESDADLINLIIIKSNQREYSCGSLNYFDSNKKLTGLMRIIQNIVNKK